MPQDLTDDKSTLVQVMAWCHQVTGHYLNQSWPRSPTPHGITRPQWVLILSRNTPLCICTISCICLPYQPKVAYFCFGVEHIPFKSSHAFFNASPSTLLLPSWGERGERAGWPCWPYWPCWCSRPGRHCHGRLRFYSIKFWNARSD